MFSGCITIFLLCWVNGMYWNYPSEAAAVLYVIYLSDCLTVTMFHIWLMVCVHWGSVWLQPGLETNTFLFFVQVQFCICTWESVGSSLLWSSVFCLPVFLPFKHAPAFIPVLCVGVFKLTTSVLNRRPCTRLMACLFLVSNLAAVTKEMNCLFQLGLSQRFVCITEPWRSSAGRLSRGCVTIPGPARVSSEQHQPSCVLCTYLLELGISPSKGDTIKPKCSQNGNRKGWIFLFQV